MKTYRLLAPITGLFVAVLMITNILDVKIFTAFGLDLPAGIIVFPLAYVFGDVLTEVYGYAIARRVIWTGFISLLLLVVALQIAGALPPAGFWPHQSAFTEIFTQVPRLVAASFLAYFCGEFVNSYIVAKLKLKTQGRGLGLRFIASTFFGQFVDTAMFITVAFAGVMPLAELWSVFVSGWLIKVGWELLALPLTLLAVRRIKRIENEDHFDVGTNFSPFHL